MIDLKYQLSVVSVLHLFFCMLKHSTGSFADVEK